MVFSKDNLAVIVACFTEKGWTGNRIAREFPNKKWNYRSINLVLAKYHHTASTDCTKGRGRPVTAMTDENLCQVEHLCLPQEDKSEKSASNGTYHWRVTEQRTANVEEVPPSCIQENANISSECQWHSCNRHFSLATVKKVIFTDEKDFTLEVPTNRQNDCVYSKGRKSDICPNRLYHHRNWFSKKVMVSAGVSWNGKTEIFFIDPQKTKVNQKTNIDFLKTSLLPECHCLYPDNDFVFMQDSTPSHRAKATQFSSSQYAQFH